MVCVACGGAWHQTVVVELRVALTTCPPKAQRTASARAEKRSRRNDRNNSNGRNSSNVNDNDNVIFGDLWTGDIEW